MTIDIKNILDSKVLNKLGDDVINTINESVNAEYNNRVSKLENDTSQRFESLVENLSSKFDNQVNSAIVESFNDNVGKTVDTKLYGVIKEVANVLESAGIPVTEKTKELQTNMRDMEKKINDMSDEYEVMKEQMKDHKKESWIHTRLAGMKPEIISHALEYFKNKDILDVQDEIETFLDNDFSNLVLDSDDDDGDLDLDKVKDALKDLDSSSVSPEPKSKFESLGKGLKTQKVMAGRTPDVSKSSLVESEAIQNMSVDNEAQEALERIDDFNNLGYHFK